MNTGFNGALYSRFLFVALLAIGLCLIINSRFSGKDPVHVAEGAKGSVDSEEIRGTNYVNVDESANLPVIEYVGSGHGRSNNNQTIVSDRSLSLEDVVTAVDEAVQLLEYEKALSMINKIISSAERGHQRDYLLIVKGRLLNATEQYDEAYSYYLNILPQIDDPALLKDAVASAFILSRDHGRMDEILVYQINRVEQDPDVRDLGVLADLYEFSGRSKEAVKTRLDLHDVQPSLDNSKRMLSLYEDMKNYSGAIDTLDVLVSIDPNPTNAVSYLLRKSELQFSAKDREGAVKTCRDLLFQYQVSDGHRIIAAHHLYQAGAIDDAVKLLEYLVDDAEQDRVREFAKSELSNINKLMLKPQVQ